MTVQTIVQETVVDQVGSVVISDITQDPNTSEYVRNITVNSPPDGNGNIAVQFTLQVRGAAQNNVELTAPTSEF